MKFGGTKKKKENLKKGVREQGTASNKHFKKPKVQSYRRKNVCEEADKARTEAAQATK